MNSELKECCKELLALVEYAPHNLLLKGYEVSVETASGDLHYCCKCKKIVGSCSFCDKDFGFPLMLFIEKGEKGMIVLCLDCFDEMKISENFVIPKSKEKEICDEDIS